METVPVPLIILGCWGLFLIVIFVVNLLIRDTDDVSPNKEKGSAEYGVRLAQPDRRPPIILGYKRLAPPHPNEDADAFLTYTGESHLLTVGSTRSGKGVGAIIPNLLKYPGSIFVVDPKGENVTATAELRQALGHDIVVIDPWHVTNQPSTSYNPLAVCAGANPVAVSVCTTRNGKGLGKLP